MMLAVIAFSMSMVGTFLVRSGILTSVHAFAIDPQRGTFLLALLAIYVGAAFALFAVRGATLKEGAPFELVSRETGLVINNLLLSVILGIVFLGTLYPLFVEALSGEKLSVGAPYFNAVAGPLALVLALLVGVGPLLSWRRERRPVLNQLAVPGLLGGTALVDHDHRRAGDRRSCRGLASRLRHFSPARACCRSIGRNPLRTPLATWGMVVAHFGIARGAWRAWPRTAPSPANGSRSSSPASTLSVGPWLVQLEGRDSDRRARTGRRSKPSCARRAAAGAIVLKPQTRYFTDPPTETNEAAIDTFWNGQLYTVIGKPDRVRRLAASAVVEAVRHLDLGRRRVDRLRRRAGAASGGCGGARRRPQRMAPGALRMSRAVRFAPLACSAADRRRAGLAARDARRHSDPVATGRQAGARVRSARRRSPASRPATRRDLATGQPQLAQYLRQLVRAVHRRGAGARQFKARGVQIDGIAVRDTARRRRRFPRPQRRSVRADRRRRAEPRCRSRSARPGVPESFIVDGRGVIRYQHIGPIERRRRAG